MTLLMLLLCTVGQPSDNVDNSFSPGFRIGPSFIASFPSMQDEKDFADMNTAAGLDFELGSVAWGGSIEILGDISEKFRFRGSMGISRLHGAYEDEYDPMSYILVGIFTGGLGFLFGETEDVVDLNDQAFTIEAQAYYVLTRTPGLSVSAGAGPVYTWATRKLDSPNTSTSGSGSGIGFAASLRLDQESTVKMGCIPLMFGVEAGYKMNKVTIDDEEADNFELDFSGPFVKVGSYIGI
ncbi:MAG: hypothetical protein K8S15_05525 [Candidatus Aegiribacteria sp.]|nr:hypothetical protein [Candidatus Aegiribacteria sp.]